MLEEWVIPLPFDKPLSLNDRLHRAVHARLKSEWRTTARWLIRSKKIPKCQRIRVEYHYVPRVTRRHDEDNLVDGFKPLVDALVDEGVVPDDTREYVERVWPIIDAKEPNRVGGRVYLVVQKLA